MTQMNKQPCSMHLSVPLGSMRGFHRKDEKSLVWGGLVYTSQEKTKILGEIAEKIAQWVGVQILHAVGSEFNSWQSMVS